MRKLFFLAVTVFLFQCKSAEKGESTVDLENTYWKLVEMNNMPIATPDRAKEVHMILKPEGGEKKITGFAGCNGLGGNYTVEGDKIKFEIIITKMFCEEQMEIENFLTKALTDADHYKIEGNTLELFQGNTFLIGFQAEK